MDGVSITMKCRICQLSMLVQDPDNRNNYICMNCGWVKYGSVQLPSDPDMIGDNDDKELLWG